MAHAMAARFGHWCLGTLVAALCCCQNAALPGVTVRRTALEPDTGLPPGFTDVTRVRANRPVVRRAALLGRSLCLRVVFDFGRTGRTGSVELGWFRARDLVLRPGLLYKFLDSCVISEHDRRPPLRRSRKARSVAPATAASHKVASPANILRACNSCPVNSCPSSSWGYANKIIRSGLSPNNHPFT